MTQLIKLLSTNTFRLALVSAAIFMMTAALLIWLIVPRATDLMTRQVMETIAAEAKGLQEQYRAGGLSLLRDTISTRHSPTRKELYYLMSPAGRKLAGNLSRLPPELVAPNKPATFTYSKRSPRAPLNVETRLAAGITIPVPGGVKLVVARDINEQRSFAQDVKWAMYGGVSLLLLMGLGGALLISRRTLHRIDTVTLTSKRIMAGDLGERIPLDGSGDELDRLSQNLNQMLQRIEQLMRGMREVSDNIAHDLRTPLTRLRNRAERALLEPDGAQNHPQALEATIEEADALIKTFNALLAIARMEAGAGSDELVPFDLSAVIADVSELYEPVAEEAGFRLKATIDGGASLRGNRQLVSQMMANLIDNALKYASGTAAGIASETQPHALPETNNIDVGLRLQNDKVQIVVADHGPGIEPNLRERALKRFVRLEASRSRPGSGLGLSLVAAVVGLHQGTIQLEDNHPGLRVVLEFPLACANLDEAADVGAADTSVERAQEGSNRRSLAALD